eukprot:TRINITY_DN4661_c0_g1_i1.p1 TRINITY_DN4661_c0_g1~~TRINITY_DN4661_c0_g1_i1.p1  ORF type:complete len:202 (-),score=64.91 TRINITY_DN4661_c0_g1_i1:80-685(-)
MADDSAESGSKLPKDPKYPIIVEYCKICSLPYEYCEYGPSPDKCAAANSGSSSASSSSTSSTEATVAATASSDDSASASKEEPKKEEVKKLPGGKTKKKDEPTILISKNQRNKRKFVTVVAGLEGFGIKLKDAAKVMANKFACGASVTKTPTGTEEIDVQGDVMEGVVDLLLSKWPTIPASAIYFLEESGSKKTRVRARPD